MNSIVIQCHMLHVFVIYMSVDTTKEMDFEPVIR